MTSDGEKITVGELRVLLDKVPKEFDRNFIQLIVIDDDARGSKDVPGITMQGFFDYICHPEKKHDTLKFYAGGEALI